MSNQATDGHAGDGIPWQSSNMNAQDNGSDSSDVNLDEDKDNLPHQPRIIYERQRTASRYGRNLNEDVEDKFLVKMMNSIVTAFFLVCIYKIVMFIFSSVYPTVGNDEL